MKYLRGGLLLTLIITSACGADLGSKAVQERPASGAGASPRSWTDVSPARLSAMLADKDFFLVNVHVPSEGELPKTDALIPFDRIESRLDDLPGKQDRIVLYCRTGRMSKIALESLAEAGYSNLFQLEGGFEAWRTAGLPFAIGEPRPG